MNKEEYKKTNLYLEDWYVFNKKNHNNVNNQSNLREKHIWCEQDRIRSILN